MHVYSAKQVTARSIK